MKKITLIISALILLLFTTTNANAQGCVAIRSTGGNMCTMLHTKDASTAKGWQLNIGNRYFKSYKHYVGTVEQKERVEQNTNVINHQYTMDVSLVRTFNERWSLLIGLPVLSNSRSQVNKFTGYRFQTHSFGMG